jgi:hypothetical protein
VKPPVARRCCFKWMGREPKISTKTLGWFYSDFQGAFLGSMVALR